MGNPYEDRARAGKVLAILAVIPCGKSREEIAKVADWLAGLSKFDRNVLAASAGAKPPSESTWSEVVAQSRARVVLDDPEEPITDTEVET